MQINNSSPAGQRKGTAELTTVPAFYILDASSGGAARVFANQEDPEFLAPLRPNNKNVVPSPKGGKKNVVSAFPKEGKTCVARAHPPPPP